MALPPRGARGQAAGAAFGGPPIRWCCRRRYSWRAVAPAPAAGDMAACPRGSAAEHGRAAALTAVLYLVLAIAGAVTEGAVGTIQYGAAIGTWIGSLLLLVAGSRGAASLSRHFTCRKPGTRQRTACWARRSRPIPRQGQRWARRQRIGHCHPPRQVNSPGKTPW